MAMHKIRLLLSAVAGLVACAAGLALLWLELIVWDKGRPNVLGVGAALAIAGAIWAVNRVMVALGTIEEDASPSAEPKAPPADSKVAPLPSDREPSPPGR
jgi:hypothetical protein